LALQRSSDNATSAIVITDLNDDDVVAVDQTDQAMLFVDPTRPCAGKRMAQLFRLPDSAIGVTGDVVEQSIDAPQSGSICRLPKVVVLPRVRREDKPHRSSSR